MATTILRAAAIGDVLALTELSDQLGYPCSPEGVGDNLTKILNREGHQIYVAINSSGQVSGWVHVFKTYRLMTPPYAELGGLVVSSSNRGEGIGTQLMHKAEGWVREMGCASLRVRSNLLRAGAHRFYEHKGFRLDKTQRVFVKDLSIQKW